MRISIPNRVMKPSILLVEDDEFIGLLVKTVLTNAGYQVEVASRLEEVAALDAESLSAVITDFQLPGADGCEIIRHLREKVPSMPALLISGYGNWAIEKCAERGIENIRHLEKPFRADQILRTVEELVPVNVTPEQ
jgi:Response regulator containing CheY-like receiver, AAA-type ATPase, and DNA-binding domains